MHKTIVWCACLLAGCANACDESASTAHRQNQPPSDEAVSKAPRDTRPEPVIDGTLVAADKLGKLLPDQVGEYRASGSVNTSTSHLPSGKALPQARRNYSKGGVTLELELLDALHTPGVRMMVKRAQSMKRETDTNVMLGFEFKGYPAIKQWTKVNETARVGTMIGDRLILNVNVKPATSPEAAVAAAKHVDYDAARALLAGEDLPDEPKPEPKPATKDAGAAKAPATATPPPGPAAK